MRFATLNQIPMRDLLAMSSGQLLDTITDMDFLETLATQRCIVVPPWIVQTSRRGHLSRVTRLIYTADGELDKARILVAFARALRRRRATGRFGPRFHAD